MCNGTPSMLMTLQGQIISDALTNSHAKMAEKYLGDSTKEDECFQPELMLADRKIRVNESVRICAGTLVHEKQITDAVGRAIVSYFNMKFRTAAMLRAAVQRTLEAEGEKNASNVWSNFRQILNASGCDSARQIKVLTNDSQLLDLLQCLEASKQKQNLHRPWKEAKQFKLSDIISKDTGRPLFVD